MSNLALCIGVLVKIGANFWKLWNTLTEPQQHNLIPLFCMSVMKKQKKLMQRRKILHEKKAFNTSIILASLNIPGVKTSEDRNSYIEQALLRVEVCLDEEEGAGSITTHLIKHLLQYAPDKEEVRLNSIPIMLKNSKLAMVVVVIQTPHITVKVLALKSTLALCCWPLESRISDCWAHLLLRTLVSENWETRKS